MATHAQRIAMAVRDLKAQGATSAAVLAGYEQWHADVAGRVCGNQQELMSRMEAVEALAGKVYKRMNWTSSVVKSNLQHLRAAPSLRMEMEHLRNQLSAVTRSYEGLCEELEAAGLEFDCEMEEISRIDGDEAVEGGVEARESGLGVSGQSEDSSSSGCHDSGAVMVGFLQGNPVSHWSGGVNLWKPPAVKPGDILVFQWFAETHDVQRFKNIFAFKACAFFNAVPLTSASQFGMRLFQVKPAHAGKTLFFGSSVGKDCQRGVKIAIPCYFQNPTLRRSLKLHATMATLRSVFVLALVLVSLPALYAASAPKQRGQVAAGTATVDAASWGRKLLEATSGSAASGADVDQLGGEEEEVGEATDDGLDEAVRVLLSWKKVKDAARNAAKSEAGKKLGGIAKTVVERGGVDALKAAANAYSSGKGAKGALEAGGSSLLRTTKDVVVGSGSRTVSTGHGGRRVVDQPSSQSVGIGGGRLVAACCEARRPPRVQVVWRDS
ncbi:unnamed protein product [Closterium sp. Yama58-4]|nr:unnamed protein product [Closterium sp. Yama58-4]